jgi:hypothetical protein
LNFYLVMVEEEETTTTTTTGLRNHMLLCKTRRCYMPSMFVSLWIQKARYTGTKINESGVTEHLKVGISLSIS